MPSMRARSWKRSIALGAWRRWARTSYQPSVMPVLGSMSFSMAAVIEVWAREMPSHSLIALAPLSLATGVILFIGFVGACIEKEEGDSFQGPLFDFGERWLVGLGQLGGFDDDFRVDLELDGVAREGHGACESVPVQAPVHAVDLAAGADADALL